MKIRTGFVSNSSSSSFIVAYKIDTKPCPHCGRSGNEIEAIETAFNNSGEGHWSELTKEQITDSYVGDKDIDKALRLYEKGYTIASVGVPYGSEGMLDALVKPNKFVIISGE